MDTLLKIVQTINMYLSDYVLIILLLGAGLYFTIRTKFVQVRCFGEGMRKVFGNLTSGAGKQEHGMSSVPGPGHRHRRSGGHRQHRGLRRSHPHRRTGGHLLDVDHRLLRHGHHLR